MTGLERVRVAWTGFIGGPGVSTFYFLDAAASIVALQAFLSDMGGLIPADVTMQVEGSGETISDATGEPIDAWEFEPQTPIVCTGSGAYAAPVGIQVAWNTATFDSGHKIAGRTFFVPFLSSQFGADGQVVDAAVAGVQSKVNTFTAAVSSTYVVWHRPRAARAAGPGGKPKALSERVGSHALVTSGTVRKKAAVLTSRRD